MDRFLLAENPIKQGNEDDQKQYIIHTIKPKLIIEAVNVNENPNVVSSEYPHQVYSYENSEGIGETWALVIRDVYDSSSNAEQGKLLDRAWRWFWAYLKWEDENIDESELSNFN